MWETLGVVAFMRLRTVRILRERRSRETCE